MKKLLKKLKNFGRKCWNVFKKGCHMIAEKVKQAMNWCVNNQEVIYVVCGTATLIWSVVKKFRGSAVEREQKFQRTHIYDRSIGHHWRLKRELTSNEMWEIEWRKRDGEKLGDILQSMRVLK